MRGRVKYSWLIFLALCCLTLTNSAQSESATLKPPRTIPLANKTSIKVVYHINTTDQKGGLNKGIYYLAYIMDHYKRLGIPESAIKLSAVFYGDALVALLKDPHYRARGGKGKINPNVSEVQHLNKLGVSIEACSETLRLKKFSHTELLDGVNLVEGSYARVVDLQLQGYAYIKFL